MAVVSLHLEILSWASSSSQFFQSCPQSYCPVVPCLSICTVTGFLLKLSCAIVQHGSTTWCYAICRPIETLFCPGQWNNFNLVLDGAISVLWIGLCFRHWILKSLIKDMLLQSYILHFGLVLHVFSFRFVCLVFSKYYFGFGTLHRLKFSFSWNVEKSTLRNSNVANICLEKTNVFLLSLKFAELLCCTSTLRQ